HDISLNKGNSVTKLTPIACSQSPVQRRVSVPGCLAITGLRSERHSGNTAAMQNQAPGSEKRWDARRLTSGCGAGGTSSGLQADAAAIVGAPVGWVVGDIELAPALSGGCQCLAGVLAVQKGSANSFHQCLLVGALVGDAQL